MGFWDFLKWFFEKGLDNFGFNKVMEKAIERYNISQAMAFNLLAELVMAFVIGILAIIFALQGNANEVKIYIVILVGFFILCFLFVITERRWKNKK